MLLTGIQRDSFAYTSITVRKSVENGVFRCPAGPSNARPPPTRIKPSQPCWILFVRPFACYQHPEANPNSNSFFLSRIYTKHSHTNSRLAAKCAHTLAAPRSDTPMAPHLQIPESSELISRPTVCTSRLILVYFDTTACPSCTDTVPLSDTNTRAPWFFFFVNFNFSF